MFKKQIINKSKFDISRKKFFLLKSRKMPLFADDETNQGIFGLKTEV